MTTDAIRKTLEAYYDRFADDDWTAIAGMFELPALLVVGDRRLVLDSPEAVVAMYRRLRAKFTGEGVARVSWGRQQLAVFHAHDGIAVARVVVTRHDGVGHPVRTWTCSYTLRHGAGAWRFFLVTSDEATPVQRQTEISPLARCAR